jgi:hypothetical protein
MQYIKHYWMRDGQYLTTPGSNGALQSHPPIQGLDVKYWLTDSSGVDYCLSVVPDSTLVTPVNPGLEILTKAEWDEIAAAAPAPPGGSESPDWQGFITEALSSPELNFYISQAISVAPLASAALPALALELRSGKETAIEDFIYTWSSIVTAVKPPSELLSPLKKFAILFNLPDKFINLFSEEE